MSSLPKGTPPPRLDGDLSDAAWRLASGAEQGMAVADKFTLIGGEELTDEEFVSAGGNVSLNHVDFMIGSPKMDIDGVTKDGSREPVMRQGEWAFDV